MPHYEELNREAYLGDLFELSTEEAAEKLHQGLSVRKQATKEQIYEALILSIEKGELPLVRGCIRRIGAYTYNPPVLEAYQVARWAEVSGLDLDQDGSWYSYISDELEIANALQEKLKSLRAQQRCGKPASEILSEAQNRNENLTDNVISLMEENWALESKLREYGGLPDGVKPHPKSFNSVLMMLVAMAVKKYGYNPNIEYSEVPKLIADDVESVVEEAMEADTTRKWLRVAAKRALLTECES